MTKKQTLKITCLIVFSLLVVVVLSAYGSDKQKPGSPELIIGGGSSGGFTFILSEAIAESIRRSFRSWSVTSSAGEQATSIKLIHEGKMQLSIANPVLVGEANKGIRTYQKPMTDVKILVNYFQIPIQFVLLEKIPISSITEWKEKKSPLRINFQKRGSGSENFNKRVLEAHGITYKDIKSWGGIPRHEGGTASMDLIRDGLLDGSMFSGVAPFSGIKRLSTSRKLKLLTLDSKVIAELIERFGYVNYTIQAGTYDFLKTDIKSIAGGLCLAASTAHLRPGIARDIVRAHGEQIEYLRSVHKLIKSVSLEQLSRGIPLNLMHPEARAYYESKGIKF
ncbi:TAXI family TRAP transporter solute-binding subunit [Thermodesulfobacteriota bacterium]